MIKNDKIILLENIVIDKTLPKYIKPKLSNDNNSFINSSISIDGFSGNLRPNFIDDDDRVLNYLEYVETISPSIINKIKIFLYKKLYGKKLENKPVLDINKLKDFFESIKDNVSELDKANIDDVLNKYSTVLSNAKNNNQIALVERINDYANVLKYELILSTSKFNKFLNEEDVVKFHNTASVHGKYNTGLHLTYIKNFIKIIPEDVSLSKKDADILNVFDNYVILHYDYSGKSVADTKKEIEKKKDPIMFGVIENSNKLYYIGDWIDDYCDLTLDVLIKTIGKEVEILNKEHIIDGINKI